MAPPWFNEAMRSALKPLEEQVGQLGAKVDGLNVKVNRLDAKVDRLGAKVDRLDAKVDRLDANIDRLDAKVNRLDAKVNQILVELRETARITNMVFKPVQSGLVSNSISLQLCNVQCKRDRGSPYKVISFLEGTSTNDHVSLCFLAFYYALTYGMSRIFPHYIRHKIFEFLLT